jgi:hypothetical protein
VILFYLGHHLLQNEGGKGKGKGKGGKDGKVYGPSLILITSFLLQLPSD